MDTRQTPIGSGFGEHTTAEEVAKGADLRGLNVLITGGYAGIGLETTRALRDAGASILVAGRDVDKARRNLETMPDVEIDALDLADPRSIDDFAGRVLATNRPIHILVNNAGIMALPLARDARGYELQFATNHLGHFQLTKRLMPALERANGARVITLTSAGHRFGGVDFDDPNFERRPYDKWKAYGQSKSANSLFSVELDRRGKDKNIRAFAVHPGRVLITELSRHISDDDLKAAGIKNADGSFAGAAMKTIPEGAATSVWCAISPQLNEMGGVYCADCDVSPLVAADSPSLIGVREWAIDPVAAERLWELSERMIAR